MSVFSQLDKVLAVDINYDIGFRELLVLNKKIRLYYLNSLVDSLQSIGVIEGILKLNETTEKVKIEYFQLIKNNLNHLDVSVVSEIDVMADTILSGLVILAIEDENQTLKIDIRSYPNRSVSEPDMEKVVRGPHDGFTENLNTNIGLMRRRIKDTRLRNELLKIGEKSPTNICLTYLDGVIDKKLLDDVKMRLNNIKTENLILADKQLEELMLKQKFNPYPLVRYTERADIVSVHLYQGMFAIFVDTSPCVILAPCTFFDHFQHTEEYRQAPLSGTYLRLLRFLGIMMALFLSPVWLLLIKYNYEIDFLSFLFPKEKQILNIFIQVILAEIGVEFLRMASIHTPSALSTAMGLIAGVILGDIAVSVGLFSYQTVLIVSLSAIGTYATPSYELGLANKLSKLFFIVSSYIFGIIGFCISILIWLIILIGLKSFNKPYLYPLIPLDLKRLAKTIIRYPYKNSK